MTDTGKIILFLLAITVLDLAALALSVLGYRWANRDHTCACHPREEFDWPAAERQMSGDD